MKRARKLGVTPRRLALGDPRSLDTRLVREAMRDVPPPGASGRALAALGLATGAATTATATKSAEAAMAKATAAEATVAKVAAETAASKVATAASVAAASATAAAPVAATKGLLGVGLTTWLAGGAIAVATTFGVAQVASNPIAPAPTTVETKEPTGPVTSSPPSTAMRELRRPDEVRETVPRGPSPDPATSAPSSEPAPSAPLKAAALPASTPSAPAVESPPAPASATVPAPASSTLGQEVALVDGARAALAGGDPARALQLLDAYDREFPAGTLAPESARLRSRAQAARQAPR